MRSGTCISNSTMTCGSGRARRQKKYISRVDRRHPLVLRDDEPSALVDCLEDPFHCMRWPLDTDPFAYARGKRKPFCANGFKACASGPDVKPVRHRCGELGEDKRRRGGSAGNCGKIGRRVRRVSGMRGAVHPNPRGTGEAPIRKNCAFEQNSAELGAAVQNIIRPFDRETLISLENIAQRMSGRNPANKTKLCRPPRRSRINEKEACIEVSGRRSPEAAAAAPPLGLHAGDNPKPPGIAAFRARYRLVIGRGGFAERLQAECSSGS